MKISSNIIHNLNESVDVHDFNVRENSPYAKTICDLLKCSADDIRYITGYQMNDWEPVDFIAEMMTGEAYLIDIEKQTFRKFNSPNEALKELFSDGANYNY